ncbi:Zinc finger protein 350 [Araneus ventricosus]|uniref:Zinc finger protein 350 n=1 Tax=Araneus ventricosus TaxID=182803 RepID=A0A4Y2PXN3_ARAVE|nr:Zinc finger protein 350 [Araneus ventricosus]
MDRIQSQSCHKIFKYDQQKSLSSSKKDDEVFSLSELNELENWATGRGETVDYLDLYTNDEVGDGTSSLNVKAQCHSEHGQFICSRCGKGFRRKDNILIHCRPDTVEKTFSYDSCEKRFFEKYHPARHLQIRRGERPFACDECERRFANKCQLTRHSRTHNGEKSYKCPICGNTF